VRKITATHKWCPGCEQMLPRDRFYRDKSVSNGLRSYCKECTRQQNKARKRSREQNRKYNIQKYGITIDEYDALLEAQDGCCAVCGTLYPGKQGRFCVDHDHTTGKIRGLLCATCNLGLGHFQDDVERLQLAIDYLNKQEQVK